MESFRASAAKTKLPLRGKKFPELARVLNTSLVVVQVNKGESQEQAWKRHVPKHPADKFAVVKVFNYSP